MISSASAFEYVNQSDNYNDSFAGISDCVTGLKSTCSMGQTFTTPVDANYVNNIGIAIYYFNAGVPTVTATLSLYTTPSKTTIISSETKNITHPTDVGASFPLGLTIFNITGFVSPGTSYYMELTTNNTGNNKMGWWNSFDHNPYSNGDFYVNNVLNIPSIDGVFQANLSLINPTPSTPTNTSLLSKTYPPLTSNINFTWLNATPATNLLIAKDSFFNLIAVDTIVTNNYSIQSLEAGSYWWKLRYYDSTSGTYGNYSDTFNFTLSNTASVTGAGIQGVAYELIGGMKTPISGATIYLYNNTLSQSMVTGSNGYYLFSGLANSTTYNIYASKQGYDTTAAFPITTGLGVVSTNDILMKIYISPYIPNFVFEKFIVRGLFDNAYPGVTITIYKGTDITPYLTGTTDSTGQFVAQLIKDQQYRITLSGGGLSNTLTYTIFAKEEAYLITIASGFPSGGDRFADINATLTSSTINATHSNLSLSYSDSRGSTTSINFYATNTTTGTTCTQTSTAQTVTLSCAVPSTGTYQFGYNATSTIYGLFKQDKVINFGAGQSSNPMVTLPGVPINLLHWMSIMLIVLVAALFSIRTVKYGAVIVPLMALVFWSFGWLQVNILLISTAMVIGVLVYIRMSEVKVNY